MRLVASSFALATAALSLAQFQSGLPPIPADLKKGFDSINTNDGRDFLGYLAGPECEGRGTGQPGFEKAANYMAAQFKKFGVKSVMPDGSYFQYNDFWRVRTDPGSLKVSINGRPVNAKEIGVASAGGVNVSGDAVVLVIGKEVTDDAFDEDLSSRVADKVVFVVADRIPRALRSRLIRAKSTVNVVPSVSAPLWTGRATAPGTAGSFGRLSVTQSGLEAALNTKIYRPKTIPYTVTSIGTAEMAATVQSEKIKIMNVVGKIEGSDPVLKDEYIGVGAHLDHLGNVNGTVYWGADDDGSGSTGVLQLAKALGTNPIKPKRSVLLMAFYGEEMGLLGSAFLANNPPIKLENMVAELQMDMIGRDSYGAQNDDSRRIDKVEENRDTMRLVGSKRISTVLDDLLQESNKHIGFKFKYDAEDVYTRSDHYNFASKGIPIAFFFCGFTPDYHQPTDTIEKINFDKIANTAKLVYLTVFKVADHPGRLPKNAK